MELARTEEMVSDASAENFSLSETAEASADAFRPLAEASGKVLLAEIAAPGQGELGRKCYHSIFVPVNDAPLVPALRGIQDNFFRLFSILLDNAVKYCDPNGTPPKR